MDPALSRPATIAPTLAPIIAVVIGIALFGAMDAAIKSAALAVGVYTALLLRNVIGVILVAPLWLAGARKWPRRRVLALHALRSAINCGMAVLFFVAIVRLPLAEGMALTFIAPLVALYLAAMLLGETVRRQAVVASLVGLAGVAVIAAERLGTTQADTQTLIGLVAVLASALLYAVNLVLQRKLALLAGPIEVALFQNLFVAAILLLFAPWLAVAPSWPTLGAATLGAASATSGLALLTWGYARAEAQVLVPVEYSAFLWAALFGWLCFGEPLRAATLAGTVLIVLACWIGTRPRAPDMIEQTAV